MRHRFYVLFFLVLYSAIAMVIFPLAALTQLVRKVFRLQSPPQPQAITPDPDEDEQLDTLSADDINESMRSVFNSGHFHDVIVNFYEDCLSLDSYEQPHIR